MDDLSFPTIWFVTLMVNSLFLMFPEKMFHGSMSVRRNVKEMYTTSAMVALVSAARLLLWAYESAGMWLVVHELAFFSLIFYLSFNKLNQLQLDDQENGSESHLL